MAFYRHISNGVVANNKLLTASNSVIHVSAEADDILCEDIQYMQVPVAYAGISHLCHFLGPRRSAHGVEMKQGRPLLLCAAFSAVQPGEAAGTALLHPPLPGPNRSASPRPPKAPAVGGGSSVHYEFKLFVKNTAHWSAPQWARSLKSVRRRFLSSTTVARPRVRGEYLPLI